MEEENKPEPKRATESLGFNLALECLKEGRAVSRAKWNAWENKEVDKPARFIPTFIYQQIGATIEAHVIPKMTSVPLEAKELMAWNDARMYGPWEEAEIGKWQGVTFSNQMNIVDPYNKVTSYQPSIEDINAMDWYVTLAGLENKD